MLLADSLTVYFVQAARSQRDPHYEEDRDPPGSFLSVPFQYAVLCVTPTQTRSARLHRGARSNLCISPESKLLRNWMNHEKTGRNDLADPLVQPTFTR
jgi:hypothetical protein